MMSTKEYYAQLMRDFEFSCFIVDEAARIDEEEAAEDQKKSRTESDDVRNKPQCDTGEHMIFLLPESAKGKIRRKPCIHCVYRRKVFQKTTFYCPSCPSKPGICIDCNRKYHMYDKLKTVRVEELQKLKHLKLEELQKLRKLIR